MHCDTDVTAVSVVYFVVNAPDIEVIAGILHWEVEAVVWQAH